MPPWLRFTSCDDPRETAKDAPDQHQTSKTSDDVRVRDWSRSALMIDVNVARRCRATRQSTRHRVISKSRRSICIPASVVDHCVTYCVTYCVTPVVRWRNIQHVRRRSHGATKPRSHMPPLVPSTPSLQLITCPRLERHNWGPQPRQRCVRLRSAVCAAIFRAVLRFLTQIAISVWGQMLRAQRCGSSAGFSQSRNLAISLLLCPSSAADA